MKTLLTVTGSSADRLINVFFDTVVTHRRGATAAEVQSMGIAKMKTHLQRYNPEVLPQLVKFGMAGLGPDPL